MILLTIFVLFIAFHVTVWNLYTSQIFGREDGEYVGDLGRTSYQTDSLYPRKLEYTLLKRHIGEQNWHNQKIDMITLGDSFSNADTGGKNPYYQDYLATEYNLNILNMRREPMDWYNSYRFVLYLYNSGWLQKHKPKYILLQTVERFVYSRYTQDFKFDFNKKPKYLIEKTKTVNSYLPKLAIINTANYKFFTSKLYLKYKGEYKAILLSDLSHEMFSKKSFANKLLVTKEDIGGMHNDPKQAIKINDNLNKLAKLLEPLNIKLIFMVSVDKYDLYQPYMLHNKYPKNDFFDNIRPLPKKYFFIDTKAILQNNLLQYKDIFYPDDTHWSFIASDLIANDPSVKQIFQP